MIIGLHLYLFAYVYNIILSMYLNANIHTYADIFNVHIYVRILC